MPSLNHQALIMIRPASTPPPVVFLDFEGVPLGPITTWYDEAPHDYNVVFSQQSGVKAGGGVGHDQFLYQNAGGQILLAKSDFFISPLTFDFISSGAVAYTIYDQFGGILLASAIGDTDGDWVNSIPIVFAGTAKFLELIGAADGYGLDNIYLVTP